MESRRGPLPMVLADGQTAVLAGPDQEAHDAVFRDRTVTVLCRALGNRWRPVSACLSCPAVVGLRRVSNKAAQYLPFQVECAWPETKPVTFVPGPTNPSVAAAVRRSLHSLDVYDVFASPKRQAMVHCPRSRRATGRWQLLSPPCPVCDHYRGLKVERPGVVGCLLGRKAQGPFVLCSLPKPCYVRGAATGASLLEG